MTKKTGATDGSESHPKVSPPSVRAGSRTAQKPPPIPGAANKPPPIPGLPSSASTAPQPPRPLPSSASTAPQPPHAPQPPRATSPASPPSSPVAPPRARQATLEQRSQQIETIGRGLGELHALVAAIAAELDTLRATERALSGAGSQKLHDLAVALRQAAGVAPSVRPTVRPKGPPPIPSARPRGPMLSTMDISEMAELVESMAPPPLPSVDIDEESW
jgi:hypothetical protein